MFLGESGQRVRLATHVSQFIGLGDFDQVHRWLVSSIAPRHASHGLYHRLGLAQALAGRSREDKWYLDLAN